MGYLVDTYAWIEWYEHGNENYLPYIRGIQETGGYVSQLTLLEFYHKTHQRFGKEPADQSYAEITNYCKVVGLDNDLIKKAARFKSKMMGKKNRMSYVDCINYVIARELGVKLLTGDNHFKGMRNVEFVR